MFYARCLLESSQVFSNPTHLQLLHERGDEASVFEHLLGKKRSGIHSINLSDLW